MGHHHTSLTLLLLASFVTYGRSKLQLGSIRQSAVSGTCHHSEARLLEDLAVVVVSVAHRPSTEMPLCIFILTTVDEPHIAIWPLLEGIKVFGLLHQRQMDKKKRKAEH